MKTNLVNKGLGESLRKEFMIDDLSLCLQKVGIINESESILTYADIEPWHRGGAETYVAIACITTNNFTRKFIAKALVSMALNPEQQLITWNKRRNIISSLGIRTPRLYSSRNGVIYEEYIDNELTLTSLKSTKYLKQIAFISAQLDKKGFNTISFVRDMRSNGSELFYVDFGSDLGEPSNKKSHYALNYISDKLTIAQLQSFSKIYNGTYYN